MIYGLISDNVIWRTDHSKELYTLYDEPGIDKGVKIED